ncbi:ATP binding cassette transporter [Phyllosticta citrichinensis]|uniref:ATP binding cassette transporter n=1 Tax=Phyllosticta citrichinensis TaxID=1130410 RepID=A0ABR1XLI9_9PEZI
MTIIRPGSNRSSRPHSQARSGTPDAWPLPDDGSTVHPLDIETWTNFSPTKNWSSDHDDSGIGDRERLQRIHSLASQYSQLPIYLDSGRNPFKAPPGSTLDPKSPHFSTREWARAVFQLHMAEPHKAPVRTAGLAFANLTVTGWGEDNECQRTVSTVVWQAVDALRNKLGIGRRKKKTILRAFDGIVEAGEMLLVLGRPGSGCTTLLKTISGDTHGLNLGDSSYINYQGISHDQMRMNCRGDAIYTAEQDVHFPMLTVGDTLIFAAHTRAPRHIPGGVDRKRYAEHMRDVAMAMYGISHTLNTKVGDEYIRGVSGGERKRISIAEATLSMSPLQCWDNSTRGLDSANALEFCKNLRIQTEILERTVCVTLYQASQAIYDVFDKVTVLYEGRQIYFGSCDSAKNYFINMGFECPQRQTTADFLTSITSPAERIVSLGFEGKVPHTPDEFAAAWKASPEYQQLWDELRVYDRKYAIGGRYMEMFIASKRADQAKFTRAASPYTLAYGQQVAICLWRCIKRLKADPTLSYGQFIANFAMALILGSVFYNLEDGTKSFFQRGALLFFAILNNAFGSALEILILYAQRPIVEKHSRYALYHPSAEAFASILVDIPYKIGNAITFNLTLYFLTNLRREPEAFFFFLLISFSLTLAMSMMFRTMASISRTVSQAMVPAALLILAIVIFAGFVLPVRYMRGWSRWINYINPVAYGFEALMVNEFHDRDFPCSTFVPSGYPNIGPENRVCSVVGAQAGSSMVSGDAYIKSSFNYEYKWRNFCIIVPFIFFFMATHLLATEFVQEKKSKGEVLVFRGGSRPKHVPLDDPEIVPSRHDSKASFTSFSTSFKKATSTFHWQELCYEIKTKEGAKRLLDHIDGWVKPRTMTALMGMSGAGKTTLLNTLAARTTVGVVSGEVYMDGLPRNRNFQRLTGYVQQQDLHLATSTVREAVNFSALLRQPREISRQEKLSYAWDIIRLLDMEQYADAVVGVPGEGLNVEQRRRLTIGVELAAKPQLLFLDEPTSGLDSQTSWAICDLIEKLANNGLAVLCTIHQPSAMLFERFDRLLLLHEGGRIIYFGDIGANSSAVINYFESKGGRSCPPDANPAEWLLEVIGAAPGSSTDIDWARAWRDSKEVEAVHMELMRLKANPGRPTNGAAGQSERYREFAAPFSRQFWQVTKRVFQQYWRTPSYIYSKAAVCLLSALFIGFVFFQAENTIQGMQNQMFAIFMLMTIFGQLVQQLMPIFVSQRSLYEARERPSKTYAWPAFLLSNIIVELPWNTLMAGFIFPVYYLIGLDRNAAEANAAPTRAGLMFLLIWCMLIFTSTFGALTIAAASTPEAGANLANLCISLGLVFSGVLASPHALPRVWIFMYRVSPFTYLVSAILSTAVADASVRCAANEFLVLQPASLSLPSLAQLDPLAAPSSSGGNATGAITCQDYMAPYIAVAGGYVDNRNATADCRYCTLADTNTFLESISSRYADAWRNFGILWAYVVFNVCGAFFLYWLVRVPKRRNA